MIEYPKITVPFERDNNGTKKLIEGEYVNSTIEYLSECDWRWTEKIDGTNISVEWDGYRVSFHGRTEKANIPTHLLKTLEEMFLGEINEEMFEQIFGETPTILYGEGYGHKIQNGDAYRPDTSFILFDIYQPNKDLWFSQMAVVNVALILGIEFVPTVMLGTINEAIEYIKTKPKSYIGEADMEGLVGRPIVELKDNQGKRIGVKVKVKDFA